MNRSRLLRLAQIVVQIVLVVLLVLLAVRVILMTADLWIPIEYRAPGFPQDRFGFSTQDRIFWSQVDVEYLLGDYDLSYFDDYTLPDGAPMHNERELKHMQDVYDLIQIIWKLSGWGALVAILGLVVLGRFGSTELIERILTSTARWTLLLMVILGVGLLVGFGVFFVGFHRIFFEGNTWIFAYSDTFIRLYPERFWRDTFALVVVLTLLEAGVLFLIGRYGIRALKRPGSDR
ncbi:MAG: TIGR01906 family membrane protein [Anaerolineales bacterium]|jgi:integral membrane protein (TIGR01906 family)